MVITVFASGAFRAVLAAQQSGRRINNARPPATGFSIYYGDLNTRLECALLTSASGRKRAGPTRQRIQRAMMSAYRFLFPAALERDASSRGPLHPIIRTWTKPLKSSKPPRAGRLFAFDTDESLIAKQYRTLIRPRNDTISHDGYNSRATDFNDTLSGFPANLIAAMTG
jgi:hypothetical protein